MGLPVAVLTVHTVSEGTRQGLLPEKKERRRKQQTEIRWEGLCVQHTRNAPSRLFSFSFPRSFVTHYLPHKSQTSTHPCRRLQRHLLGNSARMEWCGAEQTEVSFFFGGLVRREKKKKKKKKKK